MATAVKQFFTDSWGWRRVTKAAASRRDESFKVGGYFADYSELSADESSASDPEADALMKRSQTVSVKHGL